MRLLKTRTVSNTRAAVGVLVNSAKILSTLTTARGLYECNNGPEPRLSNELFHQWAGELVDVKTLHSASAMSSRLDGLCLNNRCSADAVSALMAITKQLGAIKVRERAWQLHARVFVCVRVRHACHASRAHARPLRAPALLPTVQVGQGQPQRARDAGQPV